jgi:leukotriene-A4 hydrolase
VRLFCALLAAIVIAGCSGPKMIKSESAEAYSDREDHHSYSKPDQCRVGHVALDLDVSFQDKVLRGSAILTVDRSESVRSLVLDTRDLKIGGASVSSGGATYNAADFKLGPSDKILGAPLTIELPANTTHVRVDYQTTPGATGLQWLTPAQTAGKKHPFLYSQSQAIHARSWIPIQDSPGVRVTYSARIRTPKGVRAQRPEHRS